MFLHSVGKGGSTMELILDNGEVRPVAVGNVIPFSSRWEDIAMPSEKVVCIMQ